MCTVKIGWHQWCWVCKCVFYLEVKVSRLRFSVDTVEIVNGPCFSYSLYRKHIWAALTKLTMFLCVGMNPQWINDNKVVLFAVTEVKCYLHISVWYKALCKMHFGLSMKIITESTLGSWDNCSGKTLQIWRICHFTVSNLLHNWKCCTFNLNLLLSKEIHYSCALNFILRLLQRTDFFLSNSARNFKEAFLHHDFLICTLQIHQYQKTGNSLTCHFQIFA